MEPTPNPDVSWYLNISSARGVTPRCPFASVERCPRYYQSLSLLGRAGSTKIPPEEDKRLLQRWKGSELWPKTQDYETGMFGNGEKYFSYMNFCPEVIYDRFGFFASDLSDHHDEIDRDFVHQRLGKKKWPPGHWRWMWADLKPRHFTECALYSPLSQPAGGPQEKRGELVTLKPAFMGMSVNINELVRRAWPWLRKQLGKT